jgi:glutathione-regulated potassium-efflux system ancillary protein KefG
MKKILILFAHPAIKKSRINRKLAEAVQGLKWVTFNDLYENYPDFYIDIVKEQQLLLLHDIIVWHHPFYWYSSPAILKEWFDLVLQHGFAYGENGRALEGKTALSVISTGGSREVYSEEGRNHFNINQFLAPFQQSANLCRMEYLPPFVVHGSHTISDDQINSYAGKYKKLLINLRDEKYRETDFRGIEYLNELTDRYV